MHTCENCHSNAQWGIQAKISTTNTVYWHVHGKFTVTYRTSWFVTSWLYPNQFWQNRFLVWSVQKKKKKKRRKHTRMTHKHETSRLPALLDCKAVKISYPHWEHAEERIQKNKEGEKELWLVGERDRERDWVDCKPRVVKCCFHTTLVFHH